MSSSNISTFSIRYSMIGQTIIITYHVRWRGAPRSLPFEDDGWKFPMKRIPFFCSCVSYEQYEEGVFSKVHQDRDNSNNLKQKQKAFFIVLKQWQRKKPSNGTTNKKQSIVWNLRRIMTKSLNN